MKLFLPPQKKGSAPDEKNSGYASEPFHIVAKFITYENSVFSTHFLFLGQIKSIKG